MYKSFGATCRVIKSQQTNAGDSQAGKRIPIAGVITGNQITCFYFLSSFEIC